VDPLTDIPQLLPEANRCHVRRSLFGDSPPLVIPFTILTFQSKAIHSFTWMSPVDISCPTGVAGLNYTMDDMASHYQVMEELGSVLTEALFFFFMSANRILRLQVVVSELFTRPLTRATARSLLLNMYAFMSSEFQFPTLLSHN
jgi:hypothetical protein